MSSPPRPRSTAIGADDVGTILPKLHPCVIGIDVGGTNTDCVILHGEQVIAWHKTPTTLDIQSGIETAINAVMVKANVVPGGVDAVKIGTTVSLKPSSIKAAVLKSIQKIPIGEGNE